ncbi:MAG TPA: MBL fold metallo-hydrolase [Thermoanaerobacterales bacterium]|uniref:MBL fold metallo-hydrolase n=1 Tax=Tepidanaerobacter sp. GT38 TaxID=2722793 RepID=UPI00185C8C9A|nr:MBL fold metallo-hydrolase [Tepidanaerobacter sp. GT38]MCG1012925.1 MBL fold metallo-hydrolase [Tepidanaerobacter sp. GT38]HHY41987.1 MBL fold metallo-hydrolase [Thermoanaerobacterales bacterium]
MFLKHLQVGFLDTNCYIIADEESKDAAVIDPGGDADNIIKVISDEKLMVKYIFLTHGHSDHIAALSKVKDATNAKVAIHNKDAHMLSSPKHNLSIFFGKGLTQPSADITLNGDEMFNLGKLVLKIIHTPGHTPGGISIQVDNIVFTGDTLFAGSIGRTDFPGGSLDELISSIKNKLLILEDDTKIFPGHGEPSTIAYEKSMNPFLQ